MKARDIRRSLDAYHRLAEQEDLLRQLNEINGAVDDELLYAIPPQVLLHVDQKLATKGLISLLVESIAKTKADLAAFGVELDGDNHG